MLIALINMFLEFGRAPYVNATTTTPALNEYAVFGPTPYDANIQVSVDIAYVRLMPKYCISL